MPSATLTPYKNNTTQTSYSLVSSSEKGALWLVTGRALSKPAWIEVIRKIGPSSSLANDHLILRIGVTEANASTGKLSTGSVTVDFSTPKDQSVISSATMLDQSGVIASLLNDSVANAATTVTRTALVEGRLP